MKLLKVEAEEPPSRPSAASQLLTKPHSPINAVPPAAPPLGVVVRMERFPVGPLARAFRKRYYPEVEAAQWNDWRWQLSNRVNDLAEIEEILELTDEEREGLSAPDKFRVDVTPYFISLIDPKDPGDPIRRQIIPLGRELSAFTGMMEDSLAEDRHSPVPGLVHRYPDRVLMLITTQCASYCRYCTRSRIVGDATHLMLPDIGRLRAAQGRFRALRLVHTHLFGEELTRDGFAHRPLLVRLLERIAYAFRKWL